MCSGLRRTRTPPDRPHAAFSSGRAGLVPGQQQTAVDGVHRSSDVLVLHEIDVRGCYLLRLADRSGQRALGQANKERLAVGLGDAVPERRAKSAGPDRVDADRGEFDRQSPDEAFSGSGASGGERCAGDRSLADGSGGQPD